MTGTIITVLVRNLRAQSKIQNLERDQRVSVPSPPTYSHYYHPYFLLQEGGTDSFQYQDHFEISIFNFGRSKNNIVKKKIPIST